MLNAGGEEASGIAAEAQAGAQQEEEGGDEVDLEMLDAVEETEEAIERAWGGRENVPAQVWREWMEEMLRVVRAMRQ